MKKLKWVGIVRPEWGRGAKEDSALLNIETAKRCCLGFVARRVGYKDWQMAEKLTPACMVDMGSRNLFPTLTEFGENTGVCRELMSINDRPEADISSEDREKFLTERARVAGYRFVFTNYRFVARLIELLDDFGLL